MNKPTPNEIAKACTELQASLMEFYELDEKEASIKIKKMKAQLRLSIARDIVRNLKLN